LLLTENLLDDWVRGNARDAQGVIVELVWRLVAASVPKPRERRFPLGDSIGQHGPDGKLRVDLGFDPFVPDGDSYWEIGTNLDAGAKATSDYKNLKEATPEDVRKAATFVFVTPFSGRRGWEGSWKPQAQLDWLSKRQNQEEWSEVRVIDGTVLLDWIRKFPAVEKWLLQTMRGMPMHDIETAEERWDLTRSIGEPPALVSELFLANRGDACVKLQEVIDDKLTQLKLETHYPDQVVDFISAYISTFDAETEVDALGRCLILSSPAAWEALVLYDEKHILIADAQLDLNNDMGLRLIQKARRKGHAVIFGGPRGGIPDPASIPLEMPKIQHIQEGLEKGGYNDERARSLAQKSGGNLGSLLRCIQNLSLMPQWAENSASAELAIAMLLGSWNERYDADTQAVGIATGKTYGEWIAAIRQAALRPGTPLKQWESEWRFAARYEGWFALGPMLFDDQVERVGQVAVTVLREVHPELDLPADQRHFANFKGKSNRHSSTLRLGVSEFLALLGSEPTALTSCSTGKASHIATRAVRDILDGATWQHWATLNDVLPLLAEASPSAFLAAVEDSLQATDCPFDELLKQEGDGAFTGGTYISGLLWALETLAWAPDLFIRSIHCLAQLAERDPGGKWSNRPINSLRTILLPWLPLTCADVPKRISAVEILIKDLPRVAWSLLLKLFPESHSTSDGTRRPAWRSWIPEDWKKGVSEEEYWHQTGAYARLATEMARSDTDRLIEVTGRIGVLPPDVQELLFQSIEEGVSKDTSGETGFAIWSALDHVVRKHRRFADAAWAMPEEEVEQIARLTNKLTPKDPLIFYRRLFNGNDFDLYSSENDWEAARQALEQSRRDAVAEIHSSGGFESVVRFAESTKSPRQVGLAYGPEADEHLDARVFPAFLSDRNSVRYQFAIGYAWSRFTLAKWAWIDKQGFAQWPKPDAAEFLSLFPFTLPTWQRADVVLGEDQELYWRIADANMYEADEGSHDAIDKLIQYERPHAAINCLYQLHHQHKKIDHAQVAKALLAAVNSSEPQHQMEEHSSIKLIALLQKAKDTDQSELARIEWVYLPLLEHHPGVSPKTIESEMAENSNTFCDMIRLVFRSDEAEEPVEEASPSQQNIATNAYRLLSNWKVVPGSRDGKFSDTALIEWSQAMRENATRTGHLGISLEMFGRVLTHAPEDPSGMWIHKVVAAILDAPDAETLRDGFRVQLYNSRGAHWVDPTGAPERALAEKYRTRAESVENAGFVRFASTLRDLAAEYDHEADRIIARSKRDE
jgi:hypothetical protein